ncbi:hypothetical protein CVT26_003322 [Gymnopilus dilepis]|uniref:Uncharacterized protein n=1 Tax=Gymnopilus dilepis TaxID=231916 RepID=A0A409W2T3_9AGAR|nr:hypothetical protein CVT26_003322 [Gymnopilus dilepis]
MKYVPCFRRSSSPTTADHLPVEILEQIFLLYVHGPESDPEPNRLDGHSMSSQLDCRSSPLILSQVNHRWRLVTQGHPSLWNSLHIVVGKPFSTIIRTAAHWISLSADLPLTLSLAMWDIAEEPASADISMKLIGLFVAHYDRWKNISFWFSRRFFSCHFRLPNRQPLMLEAVEVHQQWLECFDEFDSDIVSLFSSSCLRTVVWTFDWFDIHDLLVEFPSWKNLRCFKHACPDATQNFLTPAQIIDILENCSVLEHLEVVMIREHNIFPTGLPITNSTTHHHLRVLKLTSHPDDSTTLFRWVNLPMLEEIHLDYDSEYVGGSITTTAEALLDMLGRSSCTLQKFALRDTSGPVHVLDKILKAQQLRSLRSFAFVGRQSSAVIDTLTRNVTDPFSLATLPLLEHLELGNNGRDIKVSTESVLRMLESRITVSQQRSHIHQLSALKHVKLAIHPIGTWDYLKIMWLASQTCRITPCESTYIPPSIRRFNLVWKFMGLIEQFP